MSFCVVSDAGCDRFPAIQPAPGAGGPGHTEAERVKRLLGRPPEDSQVTQTINRTSPMVSSRGHEPFPSLMGELRAFHRAEGAFHNPVFVASVFPSTNRMVHSQGKCFQMIIRCI